MPFANSSRRIPSKIEDDKELAGLFKAYGKACGVVEGLEKKIKARIVFLHDEVASLQSPSRLQPDTAENASLISTAGPLRSRSKAAPTRLDLSPPRMLQSDNPSRLCTSFLSSRVRRFERDCGEESPNTISVSNSQRSIALPFSVEPWTSIDATFAQDPPATSAERERSHRGERIKLSPKHSPTDLRLPSKLPSSLKTLKGSVQVEDEILEVVTDEGIRKRIKMKKNVVDGELDLDDWVIVDGE